MEIISVLILLLQFSSSFLANTDFVTVSGPGLFPKTIVLPARYFYVNFTSVDRKSYTPQLGKDLAVEITAKSTKHIHCRVWVNKLDRKDGTFIVRYKLYETCSDLSISIYYKSKHIANSPILIPGSIYPHECNCPDENIEQWLVKNNCSNSQTQITTDLKTFHNLNMKEQVQKIIKRFHNPESTSFCHYVVKDNKIYRDCYGKHVGFNMFADNILLFLTRRVAIPDMELVINLGDWPLVQKGTELLPVFSWCGSDETMDIVMPTYDLTESVLENMGRVSLDILSVQGGPELPWSERISRAVWRGRDSRAERLTLIDIGRAYPDLFNVSLTNFFFFRDKEPQYGPKQPHISFFKFFDYKYQVNVDGTVAAYRLPYLLAGGGVVLKQNSPFYEHFYGQLKPWEHYIPVARDLSDLKDRVVWAQKHDKKAESISKNAQNFANEHLMPQHIICYHAILFKEWSSRIKSKVTVLEGMTHVPQSGFDCDCKISSGNGRTEL